MFVYNLAGVPAAATDFENNTNQKKYTVNNNSTGNNKFAISKALCVVLVLIVLLLLAGAIAATYFLVVANYCPNAENGTCSNSASGLSRISSDKSGYRNGEVEREQKKLPVSLQPLQYR